MIALGSILVNAVWLIIWVMAASGTLHSIQKSTAESDSGSTDPDADHSTDSGTLRVVYFFL
jgi:cytochrome b